MENWQDKTGFIISRSLGFFLLHLPSTISVRSETMAVFDGINHADMLSPIIIVLQYQNKSSVSGLESMWKRVWNSKDSESQLTINHLSLPFLQYNKCWCILADELIKSQSFGVAGWVRI